MEQLTLVLGDAFRLALAFNPVTSLFGSAIAAALIARRGSRGRSLTGVAVMLAAWAIGDGLIALSMARSAWATAGADGAPAEWTWLGWVLGTLGALLLGYVAPTWAGVFVGRRVTWGTGWVSAAVVAGSASGAITALAGRLG